MERKIGEIFEYQGEWYQCVKGDMYDYCKGCPSFENLRCTPLYGNKDCWLKATCEKLEKVGGTYAHNSVIVQKYRIIVAPVIMPNEPYMYFNAINNTIDIEIKQNKEDMEEKNNAKHSNSEKIGKNLKEFDLEAAKSGKPVCTRDGRKARIICFDKKGAYPIVALVNDYNEEEYIKNYDEFGKKFIGGETSEDLMMLPEKKEGWVNVYKTPINYECGTVFSTEQEAKNKANDNRIAIVRIEWEE